MGRGQGPAEGLAQPECRGRPKAWSSAGCMGRPKAWPGAGRMARPEAWSRAKWQAGGLVRPGAGARLGPVQAPLDQGKICFPH